MSRTKRRRIGSLSWGALAIFLIASIAMPAPAGPLAAEADTPVAIDDARDDQSAGRGSLHPHTALPTPALPSRPPLPRGGRAEFVLDVVASLLELESIRPTRAPPR